MDGFCRLSRSRFFQPRKTGGYSVGHECVPCLVLSEKRVQLKGRVSALHTSSESDSLTAKALCCPFPFLRWRCVDSDLDVLD